MELILKGDEIGYISNHDDQSFGMFCPASAEDVFAELSKLRAENEALRVVLRKASAALSLIEEVVDAPPEANCSCHLSTPCNDCVEWGGLRELFTSSSEAIKAIDATKGK